MKEFSFCNKPPYLTILLIKDIETLLLQFKFDHVTQVTIGYNVKTNSFIKHPKRNSPSYSRKKFLIVLCQKTSLFQY